MQIEKLKGIVENLSNDAGFDEETAWFVLDMYLTQSQEIIEEVNELLLEDVPFFKIERLMHQLKGTSGNVRAVIVMDLAIEAEQLAKMHKKEPLKLQLEAINSVIEDYLKVRDIILQDIEL